MWLPREPPHVPGAWVAPDERSPMRPGAWQPQPPPAYRKQPSQGLAMASMITGILGLMVGFCLGPIPGIAALIMGLVALSQIKKSPDLNGGKPLALVGVITGTLSILFYGAIFAFWILSIIFS
jgi:Domain of unknown function (DUF4190)